MPNAWTVRKLRKGEYGNVFAWGIFLNGSYYEGFRFREDAERVSLKYAKWDSDHKPDTNY